MYVRIRVRARAVRHHCLSGYLGYRWIGIGAIFLITLFLSSNLTIRAIEGGSLTGSWVLLLHNPVLICFPNLVIDNGTMNLSAFYPGRSLRLALLLLMLASQGIVNAHALGDSHSLETDTCSICVIGHGLGAALGASHEAPPLQVWRASQPLQATVAARVARTTCQFARAPPDSVWNTPNPT